jgi:serine protease Do
MGISWRTLRDPVTYVPSSRQMGVRIGEIAEGGPAAKAGLRPGDVITAIDQQRVTGMEVLRSVITSLAPGQSVAIEAYRSGAKREFSVTLGEFPSENLAQSAVTGELFRYGMRLRDTNKGAAVRAVLPDSAAERAGFKEGQLILRVNDKPVENEAQALTAAAEGGLLIGSRVTFTVVEDSKDVSTPVEIEVRVAR